MSEFSHSCFLFSGDDGLPLEFNVQYAKDKEILKSLIEHGGGYCTLSDDAIYLVSPGTTVLNVNLNKNLITTSYIYDCVKQNFLLETDEYRLVINEMEISDISDTSQNLIANQDEQQHKDDTVNDSVDIIACSKNISPTALTVPSSNHDFDFLDSENPVNFIFNNDVNVQNINKPVSSVQPVEICLNLDVNMIEKDNDEPILNAVPESLESLPSSASTGENQIHEVCNVAVNNAISNDNNQEAVKLIDQNIPGDSVIVSSSQPNEDGLDQFDNMVLKKAQEYPVQNDECLSQSYTVSSSADAQVSPKAPVHNISAEIFDGSPNAPDSASQSTERQQYIKDLEKDVEQILQKPSPKSIQDKITLVKYICVAKQLPLAVVLQTLQKF